MFLLGAEMSYQEHKVLEDMFETTAVSSIRLLKRSRETGIAPLILDQANVDSALAAVSMPQAERIRDLVRTGNKVLVHPQAVTVDQWTGWGWIFWDPQTWYGGYMISGSLAGGHFAGTIPTFLINLWITRVGSQDFGVLHTVWRDPDEAQALHAEIVYVDLDHLASGYIAAVVIVPEGYPVLTFSIAGTADPDAFDVNSWPHFPMTFVVPASSTPVTFEAVALVTTSSSLPLELVPKRAVRGTAGTGEIRVDDIRWSKVSGAGTVIASGDRGQYTGPPYPSGDQIRVVIEKRSYGREARAVLLPPSKIAQAPGGTTLFSVDPPGGGNPVAYQTDASGCLYLPADATGTLQLSGGFSILGIFQGGQPFASAMGDIQGLPGEYDVYYLDAEGRLCGARLFLVAVGIDEAASSDFLVPVDGPGRNVVRYSWVPVSFRPDAVELNVGDNADARVRTMTGLPASYTTGQPYAEHFWNACRDDPCSEPLTREASPYRLTVAAKKSGAEFSAEVSARRVADWKLAFTIPDSEPFVGAGRSGLDIGTVAPNRLRTLVEVTGAHMPTVIGAYDVVSVDDAGTPDPSGANALVTLKTGSGAAGFFKVYTTPSTPPDVPITYKVTIQALVGGGLDRAGNEWDLDEAADGVQRTLTWEFVVDPAGTIRKKRTDGSAGYGDEGYGEEVLP